MLFKKKKNTLPKENDILSYFMYRDSLTGQMNTDYAIKTFEKIKHVDGYGAVMVHVENAENMPYYMAVRYIKEAAQIVAAISEEEVARTKEGCFVIFSKDAENLAYKLEKFLSEFSSEEVMYAVAYVPLDENDDFYTHMRKLKRRIAAAENAGHIKLVRDLPII